MAGLYLHIPFCKQACHYCDFHFSTDGTRTQEVIGAMQAELEMQQGFITEPLDTIYFGGGTPSLLSDQQVDALLRKVNDNFSVSPEVEITLEANPDDLSRAKLDQLRAAGINRLSIGIQSFSPDLLRYLNRAHDTDDARRCLLESRAAGFKNISLDLIYAIPGLDAARWSDTLDEAFTFRPEHISAYALTIEDRTVFGNWKKKGVLPLVDDETAASQFETMQHAMDAQGYEQYEISNFARDGYYSRHNTSYWFQKPYLGIGPSAHSYDTNRRLINVRNNALYVKAITARRLPAEVELLSAANKVNEYILTRLRTRWGCDLNWMRDKLHDDLLSRCGPLLEQWQHQGLVVRDKDTLQLTRKGMLLADHLAQELMVE